MIKSTTNPKIKNIIKLRKVRERRKQGLVIVEGYKEVMMAARNGYIVDELYYCSDYLKTGINIDMIPSDFKLEFSPKAFSHIVLRENPDGVLAVVKSKTNKLSEIKLSKNPLLLILEAVEKPGNLGAILRTADAVQVDGVIICESKTDVYNPNVIRASLGTVFSVPLAVINNNEALEYLQKNKINILAATPDAKEKYFNMNLKKPSAILFGTEHEGLSDFWLENANTKILIPMKGQINSLNVSVSAALMSYEVLKQRT